jgi:hypothetical protein
MLAVCPSVTWGTFGGRTNKGPPGVMVNVGARLPTFTVNCCDPIAPSLSIASTRTPHVPGRANVYWMPLPLLSSSGTHGQE